MQCCWRRSTQIQCCNNPILLKTLNVFRWAFSVWKHGLQDSRQWIPVKCDPKFHGTHSPMRYHNKGDVTTTRGVWCGTVTRCAKNAAGAAKLCCSVLQQFGGLWRQNAEGLGLGLGPNCVAVCCATKAAKGWNLAVKFGGEICRPLAALQGDQTLPWPMCSLFYIDCSHETALRENNLKRMHCPLPSVLVGNPMAGCSSEIAESQSTSLSNGVRA